MTDDDLIRRGDAKRALILGDTFTRSQAKLDAIPAVTPGVRVKPTDAQLASACMSYRHDFGLLDGLERTLVLHQARDWLHAWQKELDLTPQPAPDWQAIAWRLRSYAVHDDECKVNKPQRFSAKDCSCGLRAALAAMEGKP